jgi:Lrp/AsnC family leucine-responsive transcriptional regulator
MPSNTKHESNELVDEVDEQILKHLNEHGRAPHEEIADDLGVPVEEVDSRVEDLEADGVIRKYAALVDPMALGYISVAFGITTDPTKTDEIAATLKSHENVYKIWILSGKHNIIVHANFENITGFQEFSNDTLHNIDGLVEYESSIATREVLSEGSTVLNNE